MNPPFSFSSVSSSSRSKRKRDSNSFDDEPSHKRLKYDVFLNYLNEETGKGFVSYLKGALRREGFTISDNTTIPVGEDVSSGVLEAIEESRIYLVVLSESYASSEDCLDELVSIMDCHSKSEKRRVFPIFFDLEPSDVRKQKGPFEEAFRAYEANSSDPERPQKWKQALTDAAQKSGLTLKENRDEERFIEEIVKELRNMQNPQELFHVECPVGVESRAQEIIAALRLSDKGVNIVAVLGIGGSGKTTIVKAVFDKIAADFEGPCFIQDVHGFDSMGRNGICELQNEVISCLTRTKNFPIISFHNDRKAMIKKLISGRKVLLVLDDVGKFAQLRAFAICPEFFSCGSRIIVTTRDKQSLGNLPYTPYNMRLLDTTESIELFVGLTFGKDDPVDNNFVKEIVHHAGGLPLVLDVWSRLFGSHDRRKWPSLLKELRRTPDEDIYMKLKISYDLLTKSLQKLFLDIACFFWWGEKRDVVVKVLEDEDQGSFPDTGIDNLACKGLVKIDEYGEISLHNMIREMGEEVVRQENEDEPGQRTRLKFKRDVDHVLEECSGTQSVESIIVSVDSCDKGDVIEAIRKMSNLRLIKIEGCWSNSSHDEMMTPLSLKKLQYMEWKKFPFKSINANIGMGNYVVVLKLTHSKLERLWDHGIKKGLMKLRILDVSYSRSLTKTGDFSGLEELEELNLSACSRLEELHSSIGCLHKLISLDVSICTQLKRFPWAVISKLKSLQRLDIRYCTNIRLEHDGDFLPPRIEEFEASHCTSLLNLPDSIGQRHKLWRSDISGCANLELIPNLPYASDCTGLVNLTSNMSELQLLEVQDDFEGCFKLDHDFFKKVKILRKLTKLDLNRCNVSHVSSEIEKLASLRELDLSSNTFSNLPDTFCNLSQLEYLRLSDCSELQLLPLLPSNLTRIEAIRCGSLKVMPFDTKKMAYIFGSKACEESFFSEGLHITLSAGEELFPEWCSFGNGGCYLSMEAPMKLDNKICGVIICATTNFKYNFFFPHYA